MLQTLFFFLVVILLFSMGAVLIVGSLKRWRPLVHPPESWMVFYPYGLVRKLFGEAAIAYLHIFIGIVFILGTLWLLLYVKFYLGR
jgi:hypothetical protein